MPPVVNPAEVQTPANIRQPASFAVKPHLASQPAAALSGDRKVASVAAPVGSIAAIESALGF